MHQAGHFLTIACIYAKKIILGTSYLKGFLETLGENLERFYESILFRPLSLVSIFFYDAQAHVLFSYVVTCYITTCNLELGVIKTLGRGVKQNRSNCTQRVVHIASESSNISKDKRFQNQLKMVAKRIKHTDKFQRNQRIHRFHLESDISFHQLSNEKI